MSSKASSQRSSESSVNSLDSNDLTKVYDGLDSTFPYKTKLTKIHTLTATLSNTLKQFADQVKDDNLQSEATLMELKRNEIGRMLTNLELGDTIRISTYFDENQTEREKMTDLQSLSQNIHFERETPEEESNGCDIPPQDVGYAWIICAAETLMMISTWGATTSFGIYISYWMNNNYFDSAPAVNYALSTSIILFLAQAMAPLAILCGNVIGLRPTMIFGSIIHFTGFLLCSFSKKLWQLYLTQGVLIGFGFSFMFNPGMLVFAGWFSKRRAFASGICIAGAGAGGMVFTLAGQKMIERTGNTSWPIRMIGIIVFTINFSVSFVIRERIPKVRERTWESVKKQCAIIFNFEVLKFWPFWSISLWIGTGIISFIVITYSLASFATFIGLSTTTGAHLTAVFNGCQAIGRPILGLTGDKFGRINLALCLNIFVTILILAFWINCTDFISLLLFAIVSGLVTGWCQVLNQAILPDSIPINLFPSAWSFQNIILGSFCRFSEVVALKLRQKNMSKPFLHAQLFAGILVIGSFFFLVPVREWKVRGLIRSRLDQTEKELKVEDKLELLYKRRDRYNNLLSTGFKGYMSRLLYPIKA
ncbi:hypothetical protein CANARDRAFT_195736 [[Candida] arabinofermentans NRRL YB-2248]|uniref:Major facilitator superfamily (MFS) profile domain-containing protein n=1 Tax=[Candida] arabinofermentans NRRL YB-2248 TaxID=983967 RepID=A0A1E4T4V8_9ASCO|nr:hypothetical protein CANARDRAFT_195736 [[Candida] arabinofermentans NRRL YB-2248]